MLYLSDQLWKIQRKRYTSAFLDRLLRQEIVAHEGDSGGKGRGGTVAAPLATVEGMSCTMNRRDGNADARPVHSKPWKPPTCTWVLVRETTGR